jgi:hypothetical protein
MSRATSCLSPLNEERGVLLLVTPFLGAGIESPLSVSLTLSRSVCRCLLLSRFRCLSMSLSSLSLCLPRLLASVYASLSSGDKNPASG